MSIFIESLKHDDAYEFLSIKKFSYFLIKKFSNLLFTIYCDYNLLFTIYCDYNVLTKHITHII